MKKTIISLLAVSVLFGGFSSAFAQSVTPPPTSNTNTSAPTIQEKQLLKKIKSIKKKTTLTKKRIKTNITQAKNKAKKVQANRLKVKKTRAIKKTTL